MTRTVLTVSLLLLPSWALAAKPNEAQIKALKAQIDKLRHEEGMALKQLDEQFKSAFRHDEKAEDREKRIRERLEHEEREALKHIDERFHHVIHHLDPKEVHHQLEEALKTLEHVHTVVVKNDDLDFHGRVPVAHSRDAAEHQLKHALHHDTPEERRKAAEAIHACFKDIEHCLSIPPTVNGPDKGTPRGAAKIAATTKALEEDKVKLEHTHHLLMAVDHEIKDYEHEKRELLKKRDEIKKKVHEEFHERIHNLSKEVHQEEHQKKELEHHHEEAKKKIKEHYANQIKALEHEIKALEKKK